MNEYICAAVSAVISLLIGVLLYKFFIPLLRSVKLGQTILEIGPSWHKSKEGTPNLGGVFFIIACLAGTTCGIVVLHFLGTDAKIGERTPYLYDGLQSLFAIFLLPVLNGVIGFIDDYIKLFKKRNKGLSAVQKLVLQFAVAAGYLYGAVRMGVLDTVMTFPWGWEVDLGIFYYVIMLLVIVYIINCANLTDGIDGLAGSIALIDCVMFLIAGFTLYGGAQLGYYYLPVASMIGALIAFLIFNFHPAKIFMGDTGSLFLGGFIVSLAMLSGSEFILLPISFIWIIEGLSVVLQVASFKLTGKRIFKMSPIHHHFEKSGWSEVRIVAVFSTCTALFAALTYFLYTLLN